MTELYLKYKIYKFLKYLRKLNLTEHRGVMFKDTKHILFYNNNNNIEYRYVLIRPYNIDSKTYEFIINEYIITIYYNVPREFKFGSIYNYSFVYDLNDLSFKEINSIFKNLESKLDEKLKRSLKIKKILK
jgi:hypothetical protein